MISESKLTAFEKDFHVAKETFPKLSHNWSKKSNGWLVKGELDICDLKGDYWNTFEIGIFFPQSYPYCVPQVAEFSKIIPRDDDWHISDEGVCCVDAENTLIVLSRRGINVRDFISQKVYPFFANQLYKLAESNYAGEEYKHSTDGVIQYYLEELKIPSVQILISILHKIINGADLTRNKLCPCESNEKIKKCHENEIAIIKSLGREKIIKDYKKIIKHITK